MQVNKKAYPDKQTSEVDKEKAQPQICGDVIQHQFWVDTRGYNGGKLQLLADIYSLLAIGGQSGIVFVGTKRDADTIHQTLSSDSGYSCSVLHGDGVEPSERDDSTMLQFRGGETNVLITTTKFVIPRFVASVSLVVNYDVPVVDKDNLQQPDYETYLHRIRRPCCFGRKGTLINLIGDQKSLEVLAAIEDHFSTMDGKEMIVQASADIESLADILV